MHLRKLIAMSVVVGSLWVGSAAPSVADTPPPPSTTILLQTPHAGVSLVPPRTLTPFEAEAIVNYVRAVDLAAYLDTLGYPIPDRSLWDALHTCEQGTEWYANGGNPNDPAGQTFQGGLGMSTDAWRMGVDAAAAHGVTLPASALDATPDQQMQGAQAFYDAHGWGWGCQPYAL